MLQWGEADEPQEELSSRRHGNRWIRLLELMDGLRHVLSQAEDSLTWRMTGVSSHPALTEADIRKRIRLENTDSDLSSGTPAASLWQLRLKPHLDALWSAFWNIPPVLKNNRNIIEPTNNLLWHRSQTQTVIKINQVYYIITMVHFH